MTKYIVVRTDQDGEAKTCTLKATDGTNKIADSYEIAEATRKYLQELFVECQYDVVELTNWETL